uniref:Uncharacterized protein n=1 Tax=Jaagichlorella roystonensis TaxID=1052852 RepID=A0A6C0M5S2_9CHLO|nr:hypothetical protein [Jaagichlorella roystonensis]QHU78332.1 hypothetical protein [Jaagichlorella roystonensis]
MAETCIIYDALLCNNNRSWLRHDASSMMYDRLLLHNNASPSLDLSSDRSTRMGNILWLRHDRLLCNNNALLFWSNQGMHHGSAMIDHGYAMMHHLCYKASTCLKSFAFYECLFNYKKKIKQIVSVQSFCNKINNLSNKEDAF